MEQKGIRPHLWLKPHENNPNIVLKYQAPYVCTRKEWETFLSRLQSLKVPSGYARAFQKHVRKGKLGSMKTHDFHIMMQTILPVCLRGMMQDPVRDVIMRLSDVWRRIYVKV